LRTGSIGVLAVAGLGGASTSKARANNKINQDSIQIRHHRSNAGATGAGTVAADLPLEITNGGPIEFGGETSHSLRIRNVDTGDSLTIIPDDGQKAVETSDIRPNIYGGDGQLRHALFVSVLLEESDTDFEQLDVTVEGDEETFVGEETFESFVVDLLDEDNDVISSTDEKLIGVGYETELEQDSTTGEIEVTIPRDEGVDEDWYAEFSIGDGQDLPIETEIDHSDTDDTFEFTVDASHVDPGEYTYRVDLYRNADDSLGDRIISIFEADEFVVDGEDETRNVSDYKNPRTDNVETDNLRTAIDDWRENNIDTDLLREVIDEWRN